MHLTEEEKEYINHQALNGASCKNIANILGRNYTSIKRYLDKNNLPSNPKKQGIPNEYYEDIFEKYNSGLTLKQIQEQYYPQFKVEQLNYICREKGITRSRGKQVVLNHNFFSEINTEAKAYFLGLFAADGHLFHDIKNGESYDISLALMKQDKYIIEKFAQVVETDKKVKEYYNKTGFKRNDGQPHIECRLVLCSKQMYNDLHKLGLMERKSKNISELPMISDEMMRHYIRGYFDGNGSAFVTTAHGYTKLRIAFYSTHDFCNNLNIYLNEHLGTNKNLVYDHKTEDCSFISFSADKDLKAIYHYLYNDSNFYLKRKKEKIQSCFNI